jgi:hypothetical protein
MTREVATQILELKVDDDLKRRLEVFGEKANKGTLSPEERQEFEEYIEANDIPAIIQAKARRVLRGKV